MGCPRSAARSGNGVVTQAYRSVRMSIVGRMLPAVEGESYPADETCTEGRYSRHATEFSIAGHGSGRSTFCDEYTKEVKAKAATNKPTSASS